MNAEQRSLPYGIQMVSKLGWFEREIPMHCHVEGGVYMSFYIIIEVTNIKIQPPYCCTRTTLYRTGGDASVKSYARHNG